MLSALLLAAALSAPAAAECEQPLSLAELDTVIRDAEQAMGRSGELFEAAANYGLGMLPCLAEVVPPEQAARLHRMLGLRALVVGERDSARGAFAASHRLEPGFSFPVDVFSASHPIAKLYGEAAELPVGQGEAPGHPGVVLWFDGHRDEPLPVGASTLVQQVSPGGALLATHYLWPGDPVPALAPDLLASAPPPEPPGPDLTRRPSVDLAAELPSPRGLARPPWLRGSLVAVAGASALAAGVSCLAAGATASDYRDNDHSLAELDQLKARNNALVFTAGGLGIVAAGAGVGVAFTWR